MCVCGSCGHLLCSSRIQASRQLYCLQPRSPLAEFSRRHTFYFVSKLNVTLRVCTLHAGLTVLCRTLMNLVRWRTGHFLSHRAESSVLFSVKGSEKWLSPVLLLDCWVSVGVCPETSSGAFTGTDYPEVQDTCSIENNPLSLHTYANKVLG